MSAIVCGKRSNSIFEELHHTSPPTPKRIRCSSSSPVRFSPPRTASQSPPSPSASIERVLNHLRSLFPNMDPQMLERALEASGNDLDSAIRSLNGLCLESSKINLGSAEDRYENGSETNFQQSNEGATNNGIGDVVPENSSAADNLPTNGSEWVELFVREMMSASDVADARARASRVLEVFEKFIVDRAGAEGIQSFHKENMILKEQVEVLMRENNILKRAVAIQHEKQKEYDETSQELQHLKQLVSQYQEQVRTLEVNNYSLAMHLRQAQQNNSIPGRFHPDIF